MKLINFVPAIGIFCGGIAGAIFHANHWPAWIGLPLAVITAVAITTLLDIFINRSDQ